MRMLLFGNITREFEDNIYDVNGVRMRQSISLID